MAQEKKLSLDDQDIAPAVITLQNNVSAAEITANAVTTAGAATYTAANMVNGVILRSGNSSGVSDTTPTATQLLGAMSNPAIGDTFVFYLRNLNTSTGTVTILAGTNVTLEGTTTCAINKTRMYVGRVTAVATPAVTLSGVMLGDV